MLLFQMRTLWAHFEAFCLSDVSLWWCYPVLFRTLTCSVPVLKLLLNLVLCSKEGDEYTRDGTDLLPEVSNDVTQWRWALALKTTRDSHGSYNACVFPCVVRGKNTYRYPMIQQGTFIVSGDLYCVKCTSKVEEKSHWPRMLTADSSTKECK